MTPEGLNFISDALKPLINYHFLYYKTDRVEYPYWVGEYIETEYSAETNYQETPFYSHRCNKRQLFRTRKAKGNY